MSKIIDLDILRPEPAQIKLGGKTFDVSYVPTGCTFEVDAIVRELAVMDDTKFGVDKEMTQRAFDLMIEVCVSFVKHRYPEMNKDWFEANTNAGQIRGFVDAIKDALQASYKGVEEYGKN
jgi:hypothetical protein